MSKPEDDELRAAWRRLAARRRPSDDALLPLETIAELAASDADDDARAAQLDLVLGHPVMAAEYALLRDLVEQQKAAAHAPPPPRVLRPWMAAAAAVALVAGGALLLPKAIEDPYRSGGAGVELVAPRDGDGGTRFVWRARADATSYRLEVLDETGDLLAAQETTDTSLVLSPPLGTAGIWRVTARLQDGRSIPSATRRVRPPE